MNGFFIDSDVEMAAKDYGAKCHPEKREIAEAGFLACWKWFKATPSGSRLVNELVGQQGPVWRKVKDKTPNDNAVYRQWWKNTYPNKATGKIEPEGMWMYFNGNIDEYDQVYDDDNGVNPVDQDNVEWLDESTPTPTQADKEDEPKEDRE